MSGRAIYLLLVSWRPRSEGLKLSVVTGPVATSAEEADPRSLALYLIS